MSLKTSESTAGLKFRKFNRFYTNVLGFLNEHIYDSPFSLTETRLLFEIYNTPNCTAKALQDKLGLDRGYVSRILKQFEKENLIYKQKSKDDARHHYIYVTETGKTIYKKLEEKANEQVELMLKEIDQKTSTSLRKRWQKLKRSFHSRFLPEHQTYRLGITFFRMIFSFSSKNRDSFMRRLMTGTTRF